MPSRASAEANSRAESAVRSAGVPVEGLQHLSREQLLRLRQGPRGGSAQSVEDGFEYVVDVVGGGGEQADAGGFGGVEALAGEVVAGEGAGVGAGAAGAGR